MIYSKFPTGEVNCKFLQGGDDIICMPTMENINDYFMTAVLACEANNRARCGKPFDLFLPYLPYSRQDRLTSMVEPFSLKVIGKILNQTGASAIFTLDAHSDVSMACIDNLINVQQSCFIRMLLPSLDYKKYTLIVPDQGASKKSKDYRHLFNNTVTCIKHRDTETGALSIEGIVGEVQDRNCIIMDDICDGGGTFILLAKELYRKGARTVALAVTHGIFTKGLRPLLDAGITKKYTTDSFENVNGEYKEVVSVRSILSVFLEENNEYLTSY